MEQQHRYEDRIAGDVKDLRASVDRLTQRVTMLLGAIALMVFLIPVLAPFIRGFLGLP